MDTKHTTITVLDYCNGLRSREFAVDKNYQRSDKVWPTPAKSFLIETILLDYPIPKLSLHQKLDMQTRTVVKNIVDGQQRSRTIQDFYENKFRLSRVNIHSDFAGCNFSQLDTAYQEKFLNYGLDFDLFVGASDEQVREIFRRMNSFTVPLNAEEQRHSNFQGPFKWFINQLVQDFDQGFEAAGVFTSKQLNRMVDSKLLTEVTKAMLDGITTTSKATLDTIYRKYDAEFERADEVGQALRNALQYVLALDVIRDTSLAKPYNIYALLLAYVQAFESWTVDDDFERPLVPSFTDDVEYNLELLADAVDTDYETDSDWPSEFAPFISATQDRTNVTDQRKTRFRYFLAAVSEA